MTATVRVMSAEEIAAQAGGSTPFLLWPDRATMFAERAMRLRQLAGGHAMGDYLRFMAALAMAQQRALAAIGDAVPLPSAADLDAAARAGRPPLPAVDWPRDAAWRQAARQMAAALAADASGDVPAALRQRLGELPATDDDWFERQADALLTGVMQGLELATSALVAGALQAWWTHLVGAVHAGHQGGGQAFGLTDDRSVCPCCGSRPTVSITRHGGQATGQRYLHCSLCATQWHVPRGQCSHCGSKKSVAYQSLALPELDDGDEEARSRAAQAAVQAETCDDCNHYLKILHTDRDAQAEPVADDLASITLDLLVADGPHQRHGVNLMLLFGAPDGSATDDPPP
ncbi:MAG: formate dehydrogenase accessory protein FdhE [Aquabacterium sp.]